MPDADAIIVGAGLAGLVAARELSLSGKRVILLEQEPAVSLGGQAFWSLGGLFLVNTPEQRRLRIRDSLELARQDWFDTAGFDSPDDYWDRQWAEAFIDFAAGEKRVWLRQLGIKLFPLVGWAERKFGASRPGNSVPRFHVTWGTGPGVLWPFVEALHDAESRGLAAVLYRHRVEDLTVEGGRVTGVSGSVLKDCTIERGQPTTQQTVGTFALSASSVLLASGGIGGNPQLVAQVWPPRLGAMPTDFLTGVPAHVDGAMLMRAQAAGGAVVNRSRMWHYTEGIKNWDPIWPNHGIRILPGPSSLWLDASGNRMPSPCFPGVDTLGALQEIQNSGFDHTWFVLNQAIIRREFALSGSEQNPDLTGKSLKLLGQRLLNRRLAPGPVEAFKMHGEDFVIADRLHGLIEGMQRLTGVEVQARSVARAVEDRDNHVGADHVSDDQLRLVREARSYFSERAFRVAKPARLLNPESRPLIAVRLRLLTRKTLGGLQTNLDSQVLDKHRQPIPGLYAAGEVAGFGGGGVHGYRSLEGTFLGGCLFSGRIAGRTMARCS